jgi:hypothetical protein
VALVPQWRQDYPDNRPPRRATVDSEMGHERLYALQQKTSAWPRFGAANIKPNL